jgi:NADPH:quinone reductase-like Zn-dependent oxidoreductase
MSFEEAAAIVDGGYQGLMAIRYGNVGEGTRLLVYGATGSCGTAAVQLAKHFGADVTGVANTKNVELVRSLGRRTSSITSGRTSRRPARPRTSSSTRSGSFRSSTAGAR